MEKNKDEISLKLNKFLYKKKDFKSISNKKSNNSPNNNINIEAIKEYNEENMNKYYIPKKIIFKKSVDNIDKLESIGKEKINIYYNSNKIINGSINNEKLFDEYNKQNKYKTINSQKTKRKYSIDNYRNGNNNIYKNNIEYYIDKDGNPQSMKILKTNNLNKDKNINIYSPIAYIVKGNEDKNTLIDLKGNIINQNKNGDYSILNDNILIIKNKDVQHPELKIYRGEKHKTKKRINYDSNPFNSSSVSPKLYFDYKRITNLLTNNSLGESNNINKTNNNLFRKKKISMNNCNNHLLPPLDTKKIYEQKKIHIYKNYSFNNNKKLINSEDNNDDICISNSYKKENINNSSSNAVNTKNNSNVIERNYNLYFIPTASNCQYKKFNYYNYSNEPEYKTTENNNNVFKSKYPSDIHNKNNKSNTIVTNERKNKNNKYIKEISLNTNLKTDKFASAINIFNKNKKNNLNNFNNNNNVEIIECKSSRNNKEKRVMFKKKNKSFNNFNLLYSTSHYPITNKILKSNGLSDDIHKAHVKGNDSNLNENNNSIKYLNQLNEQKKFIISDYCSNYTYNEDKKKEKKKNFYFNNNSNSDESFNKNNKNKINIRKNLNLNYNFEEKKNDINEEKKINNIIKKYKNINSLNSCHSKNNKSKNLIFTYERLFKHQTSFFKPKIKNKFPNEDISKDDITYINKRNKKKKIKYLTPYTSKNKENNNIINNENNKIEIHDYQYENSFHKDDKKRKKIISCDEKNFEFDFNMGYSKSILNNIKYENNIDSYNFRKIKANTQKQLSTYEDRNLREKKVNKSNKKLLYSNYIKENEKNKNIFGNINNNDEQKKSYNDIKYLNVSKNNDSKEYINNCYIYKYNNDSKNLENISYIEKDNSNSSINIDINKDYFQKRKKPVIINSQSCIYDNYANTSQKSKNNHLKCNKRINDYYINNKTINNCSNRYKNILESYHKIEKRKCDYNKENYDQNEDIRKIDSDNLLLVTNISKCPQCHCLLGNLHNY